MRKLEVIKRQLGLDLLHEETGAYTVVVTKDNDWREWVDCGTINLWEDLETIWVKGESPYKVKNTSEKFTYNGHEFVLEYRIYSELEVEGWELKRTTIVHP